MQMDPEPTRRAIKKESSEKHKSTVGGSTQSKSGHKSNVTSAHHHCRKAKSVAAVATQCDMSREMLRETSRSADDPG